MRTDDEEVAREWAAAYVRRFREQGKDAAFDRAPRGMRVERAIKDYLAYRKGLFAAGTVASDRGSLGHIRNWCGKDLPTDRILVRHERARLAGYAYLQDLVDERLRSGYAPSTILTWATCWAPFFTWLRSSVRVWDLALPELPERDARPWTDEEIEEIRDAADYVDRARREKEWPAARRVVEFFLASGCRQQEGYAGELQRIREDDATIRLVGQLNRDHREIVPLKGKRARTVLLLPFWWPHHTPGKGYVLARPDGQSFRYRSQCNLLDRVLDACQLNDVGVGYHRFRHTYARLFIEGGGRLEELQKSLGHSSIVTTEREYAWLHEDVAARLAKLRIYGEPKPHAV